MPHNIMCLFLIGGFVNVFRLHQENLSNRRIIEMATLIIVDPVEQTTIKDRFMLHSPEGYPVSTEHDILKWLNERRIVADCSQSDIGGTDEISKSASSGGFKILKGRPTSECAEFKWDPTDFTYRHLTDEDFAQMREKEDAFRCVDYLTLLPSLEVPEDIVKASEEVSKWHKLRGLERWEFGGVAGRNHYAALKATAGLVVAQYRAEAVQPSALSTHIDELDNLLR